MSREEAAIELGSEPLALDQTSFARLRAAPSRDCVAQIRAALERGDHDDAAVRALAGLQQGVALPASLIADVLVGVVRPEVFLPLARQLPADAGEHGASLVELLRLDRFGEDMFGLDQAAYAAFVLWQRAPDLARPAIVPTLRRLARSRATSPRAVGVIAWLSTQIGDPHLRAVCLEHMGEAVVLEIGTIVGDSMVELWGMTLDEQVALLPEQEADVVLPGTPVRAAPKVGRNELCPCGSGKKFKRCCADKPGAAAVPRGPSRAEQLRALEPRLEDEQVHELTRRDLAQLDLTRLRDRTVIEVMRRWVELREWRRARQVVDELERRGGREFASDHLEDLLYHARAAGRYDVVGALAAGLQDPAAVTEVELELAIAERRPDALDRLEAAARGALRDDSPAAVVELAHGVLHTAPALGILVGRGALHTGRMLDGEVLVEVIEEARDVLALPPGDPAQGWFEAAGGVRRSKEEAAIADAERARLTRTTAALRADLDQSSARLATLQQQMAERERELARVERAAAEASQRAARSVGDEQDRRAMRDRIEELQALIREGNSERADLRRRLAETTEGRSDGVHRAAPHGRAVDDADEDGEMLSLDPSARGVVLPRFGPVAAAAFDAVARNVAATAMRTVGNLAAGDAAAWRSVKQAKDMPRQVLMTRIGIHHRLLFRIDGVLDVLDLVTRESLLVTLKRLRSG